MVATCAEVQVSDTHLNGRAGNKSSINIQKPVNKKAIHNVSGYLNYIISNSPFRGLGG